MSIPEVYVQKRKKTPENIAPQANNGTNETCEYERDVDVCKNKLELL